jgi:hypothetical protein
MTTNTTADDIKLDALKETIAELIASFEPYSAADLEHDLSTLHAQTVAAAGLSDADLQSLIALYTAAPGRIM